MYVFWLVVCFILLSSSVQLSPGYYQIIKSSNYYLQTYYYTNIDCYEWYSKTCLPRWSMERSSFLWRSRGKIERSTDHRVRNCQHLFYRPNTSYIDSAQFIKRPATINQTNTWLSLTWQHSEINWTYVIYIFNSCCNNSIGAFRPISWASLLVAMG